MQPPLPSTTGGHARGALPQVRRRNKGKHGWAFLRRHRSKALARPPPRPATLKYVYVRLESHVHRRRDISTDYDRVSPKNTAFDIGGNRAHDRTHVRLLRYH